MKKSIFKGFVLLLLVAINVFALSGTILKPKANDKSINNDEIIDYSRLTTWEMNFLLKNCPDINYKIEKGVAIVYGKIINPPILITHIREKIYLNGIQIYPKKEKRSDYLIRKKFYKLHEYYFNLKQKGDKNALKKLKRKLNQMKNKKEIDDFIFNNPRYLWLDIFKAGKKYGSVINYKPWPGINKLWFIMHTIFRQYSINKKRMGKEKALNWLDEQLNKLKNKNIIEKYKLFRDLETVDISFVNDLGSGGFGFYGPRSPRAKKYEQEWKAKQGLIMEKIKNIKKLLNKNKILIYSYSFEKVIPYNSEILSYFKELKKNSNLKTAQKEIKSKLNLTDEELEELIEELE